MQAVSVRELEARLSSYLRMVADGEIVLITDRGEVIAEIRPRRPPADVAQEMHGLWQLAQQGIVRLGKPNRGRSYAPPAEKPPDGTASSLLDADREDRF